MQLTNLIILLLLAAAVASFAVNSVPSGVAILVIVVLNAGIAAATENHAGNALEALSQMTQPEALVLRDGAEVLVASSAIVRGDIVVLRVGDVVPADLRLVEAHDLKVNEMPLTGESEDVSKLARPQPPPPTSDDAAKLTPEHLCFSGCSVSSGSARGVVVATGMHTRVGAIARLLADEERSRQGGRCFGGGRLAAESSMTPLQASLQRLGVIIGVLAIFVCGAVFAVGLALDTRNPQNPQAPGWLYMILISITLTVAAIPEGIPLCVTISLSSGCSAMVSRHVLVRRLAAVETLGSASVICSDKTGTLTEGKMRAVKLWAGGMDYDISGVGFDPTTGGISAPASSELDEEQPAASSGENGGGCGRRRDGAADVGVRSTLAAALLCSNARVTLEEDEDNGGAAKWVPSGNSSEVPLVVAALKVGLSQADCQRDFPRLLEIPFSSVRKLMLTVCGAAGQAALGDARGMALGDATAAVVCVKGAPSHVMDACAQRLAADGSVQDFTLEWRAEAERIVDEYSSRALRVLAVAARPLPAGLPFDADDERLDAEDKLAMLSVNLTFLGLVASIDPPREGVREAVQAAHDGHIRVMMITGDYLKTGAAIAEDVGILKDMGPGDHALDCSRLRPHGEYLPDAQMDLLTKDALVFARAKPEDKLKIVQSLQRQGLVSAMTGDGVNDAPALKAADIGVAMGIQGTEVAKGASDMVLTDDNFVSIVGAVEKGRVIYAGIQKFVAFIMSVHIAEVLQIFACVVAEMPVMRSPIQILYLILVTDLAPSIALGMEPGEKDILFDNPRPKKQPILLCWMWTSTTINAIILTAVIICVYVWALLHYCGTFSIHDIVDAVSSEEAEFGLNGPMSRNLEKARTVAFVSLVWSENVRAYTSRSFDRFVCRDLLGNWFMQRAIGIAEAALFAAVLLPGLTTVLGLRGLHIGWEGWFVAFIGAAATLVLCEFYKLIVRVVRVLVGGCGADSRSIKGAAPAAKLPTILCGGDAVERKKSTASTVFI
eukprot:TRINITY_DN31719_c0_g1_i1.p1 TRINITY_DN31719_c0_g1~~TRINITY_DN31719_c0_g1_i1.p1  ORF type:complete len:1005 (-),score=234.28 TRINITY_DN31719_c0_g1_i1:232-3246(-)